MSNQLFGNRAIFQRLSDCGGALLVVGHGTRVKEGQLQLLDFAAQLAQYVPCRVEASFLELADPNILSACRTLVEHGIKKVYVVPVLLFTAAHANDDIPGMVEAACQATNIQVIGYSRALECSDAAIQLSLVRCARAIACTNSTGCDRAGFCEQASTCCDDTLYGCNVADDNPTALTAKTARDMSDVKLGQLLAACTVVFIGRGTSEKSARDMMREFARLRSQRCVPSRTLVAFFVGDPITIEIALEQAALNAGSTVIVQPHLLFEGKLTQQLRDTVQTFRQRYPHKKWLVAGPLGGDDLLCVYWAQHVAVTLESEFAD